MRIRKDIKLHLSVDDLPNDTESLIEGIRLIAEAAKEAARSNETLRDWGLTSGEIDLLEFMCAKQRVILPSTIVSGRSIGTMMVFLTNFRKKLAANDVIIPGIGKPINEQSQKRLLPLISQSDIHNQNSDIAKILGFSLTDFAERKLPKDVASLRATNLKLISVLRGNVENISIPGIKTEYQKTILAAIWAKPSGNVSLNRLLIAIDTPFGEPTSIIAIKRLVQYINRQLPYKNLIVSGGLGIGYKFDAARRELLRPHITFKTDNEQILDIAPVRNDLSLGSCARNIKDQTFG